MSLPFHPWGKASRTFICHARRLPRHKRQKQAIVSRTQPQEQLAEGCLVHEVDPAAPLVQMLEDPALAARIKRGVANQKPSIWYSRCETLTQKKNMLPRRYKYLMRMAAQGPKSEVRTTAAGNACWAAWIPVGLNSACQSGSFSGAGSAAHSAIAAGETPKFMLIEWQIAHGQ